MRADNLWRRMGLFCKRLYLQSSGSSEPLKSASARIALVVALAFAFVGGAKAELIPVDCQLPGLHECTGPQIIAPWKYYAYGPLATPGPHASEALAVKAIRDAAESLLASANPGMFCPGSVVVTPTSGTYPPSAYAFGIPYGTLQRSWQIDYKLTDSNSVCSVSGSPMTAATSRTRLVSCAPGWNQNSTVYEEATFCYRLPPVDEDECPCENPVYLSNGRKAQTEVDYQGAGAFPLNFTRTYSNIGFMDAQGAEKLQSIGTLWRPDSYYRRVEKRSAVHALVFRGNEPVRHFSSVSSAWSPAGKQKDKLVELSSGGVTTGWIYTSATNEKDTYDASGRLVSTESLAGLKHTLTYTDGTDGVASAAGGYVLDETTALPTTTVLPAGLLLRVEDDYGRRLSFGYDAASRVKQLVDPAGEKTIYSYDGDGNLASVTYPDGKSKTYVYGESAHTGGVAMPNALTGIIDEKNTRFATYTYSGHQVVNSTHAHGSRSISMVYSSTSPTATSQTTSVTDSLGTVRTTSFASVNGTLKETGTSIPGGSGSAPASSTMVYDSKGNVEYRVDFNGNRTNYTYDSVRNLETSRTEGLTSAGGARPESRTIETTWHSTYNLPSRIVEKNNLGAALRETEYEYDAKGNRTLESVKDVATGVIRSTTWAYSYGSIVPAHIQSIVVDGPRTDVSDMTTIEFWPENATCSGSNPGQDKGCRGQIKKITDAMGTEKDFNRYNAHGQVEEVVDANNLTTTMAYDERSRLVQKVVSDGAVSETTQYSYDAAGLLATVTNPDNSAQTYSYDDAHRLTGVTDSLGNSINYTLNGLGNRVEEVRKDSTQTTTGIVTRTIDPLGRVQTVVGQ